MDLLSQTAFLISATGLALGFATLARNVRNALFISFAVLAFAITGWAFSFFIYQTFDIPESYRIHLAFNIWLAPIAIFFIRILTRTSDYTPEKRWLTLSLIFSVALSIMLAVGLDALPWVVQLIYYAPTPIALQIIWLMLKERKKPAHTLIYVGALVVLSTSLLDHVPALGTALPVFGNLLLTAYLFLLCQAITQQKSLDFRALISRFIVLAVIAVIIASLYALFFHWIKESPTLFFINSFIVSFVILMLLDPLRSFVRYLTDNWIKKTQKNLLLAIQEEHDKERLAEIGQMAAGLAHEIRNPLGAIQGAIQFIDPSLDRPEKPFLEIILEETRRLDHVVTRFLEFSKNKPPQLIKTDLNPLVEKTIQNLRPGLAKNLDIRFEQALSPAWIQCDPEQIQQVLINMILNSSQALQKRPSGQIHLRLQNADLAEKSRITLTIEDNGPGITKLNQEKIFLPFFTTTAHGTGLGLSISHKIIQAHQGKVEIQSEEGNYTRFVIGFPRC